MSQWLPYHPTISDPSTGEPLRALAIVGNMPIWPQFGAEGEENNGGSEGETEGEGSSEGETETEGSEGEGEGEKPRTYTAEEYEALHRRMQAADRRASGAEQKVKDFEKAGQTELEKAQSDAQENLTRAEAAEKALQDERIANAFLASNDVTWHDNADALSMLRSNYMDGVEIGEDGKVKGMKAAISKMAKEKKYLVNSGTAASTSATDQMNGKRKGNNGEQEKAKDADLAKRMPALGRRIPMG